VPGLFIFERGEVQATNSTMTIEQVLRLKGRDFFAISPNATAYEALELMAEKNIGRSCCWKKRDWSAFFRSGIMRRR
jgi:hypothetical protein